MSSYVSHLLWYSKSTVPSMKRALKNLHVHLFVLTINTAKVLRRLCYYAISVHVCQTFISRLYEMIQYTKFSLIGISIQDLTTLEKGI
jgi:hypothetical protein